MELCKNPIYADHAQDLTELDIVLQVEDAEGEVPLTPEEEEMLCSNVPA